MRRPLLLLALLIGASASLPALTLAAEPPNQNDPCSRAGRNTCDTNGVGQYKSYRYGVRWFGDYRGAVDGVRDALFCIDLRFWYPGRQFKYEESDATSLRNRDGDAVSAESLRRMSYAIWRFGRSNDRVRQGAVMLYVHRLMGDGAPGEVDPSAVSGAVAAQYAEIERDAARYAGPYKLEAELPATLNVGENATLSVRVRAASGALVPGVAVSVDAKGAGRLPSRGRTGADGVAKIPYTADAAGSLSATITSADLPAARPAIYTPSARAAARNGQRLAGPASVTVRDRVTTKVERSQLRVSTKAEKPAILLGENNRDTIRISGAPAGWSAPVEVRLYGPARQQNELNCSGPLAGTVTYTARRGASTTPPIRPLTPGWYGYQLLIPSTGGVIGTTTTCGLVEESFKVEVQPRVQTVVSTGALDPGGEVFDTVKVEGLWGESARVEAALYGPFPAPDKMSCDAPTVWSGSFTANGDGEYKTDKVKLDRPGYYTYREKIPAQELVRAAEHACGEAPETTIVRGKPKIETQISAQQTAPGAQITDTAVVSGLGALSAQVNVELWGPFNSAAEIRCEGEPFWKGTFAANGDGSYTTEPVTLTKAGYYTYRESIFPSAAFDGVATACGEAAETTIAQAKPTVTTVVSNEVVRPGLEIFDTIRVTGLGQTPATVEAELFGPFPSRAAIRCTGTPFWKGTVDVAGDGEATTEKVRLNRAGFYTYRERIRGTPAIAAAETECAEVAETSLASPLILTGGRDADRRVARVRAAQEEEDVAAPTRVVARRLGIDAPVRGVTIDTRTGALDVPKNIDRVGWWRDGAAPGARAGSILLAGHVDSARRGAGAFYALKSARRGDRIQVTTDDNRTRTYRVTGMRRVLKSALPASIYSVRGSPRLVLVTCGGPFNQATGHYRDNVIVTAEPREGRCKNGQPSSPRGERRGRRLHRLFHAASLARHDC